MRNLRLCRCVEVKLVLLSVICNNRYLRSFVIIIDPTSREFKRVQLVGAGLEEVFRSAGQEQRGRILALDSRSEPGLPFSVFFFFLSLAKKKTCLFCETTKEVHARVESC